MIELLQPEDLKNVSTFAPQESLRLLNTKIMERLKKICKEEGHIPRMAKIADIKDTHNLFEDMQWGYECRLCFTRLRPIAYEEIK